MYNLKDKVALVTGGAQGIGRAISLKLAQAGATVIVNYNKSETAALELVKEINVFGKAFAYQADISQFESAKNLIDQIIFNHQTLNIVVNNAGITRDQLILRMQEDDFDRVIETNLKGVWNVSKHAARVLLKADNPRIINISSVSGILGNVGQTNYSAAKAGVIGFTKALARELAGRKVTVNAIAPGFIETKMTQSLPPEVQQAFLEQIPLKRFGQIEEIAAAVCFLASNEAAYITGHVLKIDGGMAM